MSVKISFKWGIDSGIVTYTGYRLVDRYCWDLVDWSSAKFVLGPSALIGPVNNNNVTPHIQQAFAYHLFHRSKRETLLSMS